MTSSTKRAGTRNHNLDEDVDHVSDQAPLLNTEDNKIIKVNNLGSLNSVNTSNNNNNNNNNNNIDQPPTRVQQLSAAFGYALASIGIQVALKLCLTTMSFPSSLFVALLQSIFTVTGIFVLWLFAPNKINMPTPSWYNMMVSVQPLPLIQVLNVGAGLVGTKLVSIPMFTVLRRFSIPLTLVAEVYILKMVRRVGGGGGCCCCCCCCCCVWMGTEEGEEEEEGEEGGRRFFFV